MSVSVLQMADGSMHPAIPKGWGLIVERGVPPVIGEYVRIETSDGQQLIREFHSANASEVCLVSYRGGVTPCLETLPQSEVKQIDYCLALPPNVAARWLPTQPHELT